MCATCEALSWVKLIQWRRGFFVEYSRNIDLHVSVEGRQNHRNTDPLTFSDEWKVLPTQTETLALHVHDFN